MTPEELNAADDRIAFAALKQCCGSDQWVRQMMNARPFANEQALLAYAARVWNSLEPQDWREAFAHHPKIGGKASAKWSSEEQSGVNGAAAVTLSELARLNIEYENKFGWIFLICASGKSAAEMLSSLRLRMGNEPSFELRIAAAEQAKITELRLQKLLAQ